MSYTISVDYAGENSKDYTCIVFGHPYGKPDYNGSLYSKEVLLKAYREKIGEELITNDNKTNGFVINEVFVDEENNLVMIRCIK